ncbi:LuxR C-terminal-related transcriptional regulator [Microbacterium sp. GXS0129]|uniref:helix-turn-helix transcriptional regulator n=1 Tax=Microbacterium sp. GXS0129 TaxID=3377836 RepID=UPI003839FA72
MLSPGASPETALDLLAAIAARRQPDDLWDQFLDHAHLLREVSPTALTTFSARLTAESVLQEPLVAAVWLWIRRRIERVPSQESLGVARFTLERLRQQPTERDLTERLRGAGCELIILLSTASYEAAADAADALRDLLPQLSPAHQVEFAAGIRYLLDMAVDAYIGACRLDDAETTLDARGATTAQLDLHEVQVTRAFLHAVRGDAVSAGALLRHLPVQASTAACRDSSSSQSDDNMSGRQRIARAAVLFHSGEPEHAVTLLGTIEQMYPRLAEWPFAAFIAARAFTATDPVTGAERLQRLMHNNRNVPTSRRLQHLLRSAVADLSLASDDVPAAQKALSMGDPEDHLLRISAARLSLITGDPDAVRDLEELLARPDLWPQTRAQALLLVSVHLHRAGYTLDARGALHRAIAITSALGIRFFQSLVPVQDLHEIAGSSTTGLPTDFPTAGNLDAPLASIRLTKREAVLLARLESGSTMNDIAATEFVTLNTVKSQARSVYRKLGAGSRHEAIEQARRRGILR